MCSGQCGDAPTVGRVIGRFESGLELGFAGVEDFEGAAPVGMAGKFEKNGIAVGICRPRRFRRRRDQRKSYPCPRPLFFLFVAGTGKDRERRIFRETGVGEGEFTEEEDGGARGFHAAGMLATGAETGIGLRV